MCLSTPDRAGSRRDAGVASSSPPLPAVPRPCRQVACGQRRDVANAPAIIGSSGRRQYQPELPGPRVVALRHFRAAAWRRGPIGEDLAAAIDGGARPLQREVGLVLLVTRPWHTVVSPVFARRLYSSSPRPRSIRSTPRSGAAGDDLSKQHPSRRKACEARVIDREPPVQHLSSPQSEVGRDQMITSMQRRQPIRRTMNRVSKQRVEQLASVGISEVVPGAGRRVLASFELDYPDLSSPVSVESRTNLTGPAHAQPWRSVCALGPCSPCRYVTLDPDSRPAHLHIKEGRRTARGNPWLEAFARLNEVVELERCCPSREQRQRT